jgi:mono/diheme cytochrome c family protein
MEAFHRQAQGCFHAGLDEGAERPGEGQHRALLCRPAGAACGARGGPRAAEGREHFVRNCVRCHGAEARGGENFRASPASRPNTCAAI